MGRRSAELILYEPTRPLFHEPVAFHPDHPTLSRGRSHVELRKVVETSHAMIDRTLPYDLHHAFLQRGSARYNNTDADRTFTMKSLKVLQIAIKKRIFFVPLDLQCNGASIGSSYMVDLMRDRSSLNIVDGLSDDDIALDPIAIGEGPAKPLRRAGFATPAPDQLHICDPNAQQDTA